MTNTTTEASKPAAAQEAVARPEPYIIGNQYRTQAGDLVRFVAVHNEGTSYECMEDESGVNRYTRRDFGRVTGTCHEYSDPRNTPPLYAAPIAAAPGIDLEQFRELEGKCQRIQENRDFWHGVAEKLREELFEAREGLAKKIDASPKGGSDAQPWKLLEQGNIIRRGDQLLNDDCATWSELVGWEVGLSYNPTFFVPMRRSQATSAEVGA